MTTRAPAQARDGERARGGAAPAPGSSAAEGGRRALLAAAAANVAIALAKLAAFAATGSTSMLAEASHSIADTAKQGFLFVGRHRAARPADAAHPFGYGNERYFWALLVSIVLLPLGAAFALRKGVSQALDPEPLAHVGWALGTLLVAMLFEASSLAVAVREARRSAPGHSLWRFVRRSRDPDVPAVVVEDAGAVAGLVIALAALGLAYGTGDPRWDALGGIGVAVLMLVLAAVLTIEFKSLLIGESATPEVLARIVAAIHGEPRLTRTIYVRTLHLAPDELLVAAKVELDHDLDFRGVVEAIDRIESAVYRAVPSVRILHVEPDVDRADERPPEPWMEPRPDDAPTRPRPGPDEAA